MDASGGHAWRAGAACFGETTDLFFRVRVRMPDKAEEPDPDAKAICDRCQVRPECLNAAFVGNEDGTWGGTSFWQRQQLKRRYRRAMCPVCRETGGVLLELGEAQACLACAVSWRATPAREGARG